MGRSRTIYVGNLPGDIREKEIEDIFYKYGNIIEIDLKIPPRPPGYAFIEFEDARDAEDAIYGRDGYNFHGYRLRVEIAHGGRGGSSSYDRHSSFSSGGGSVSRRSDYQGLFMIYCDWFTIFCIMARLEGEITCGELVMFVFQRFSVSGEKHDAQKKIQKLTLRNYLKYRMPNRTVGIVDYTNYDDMKYAIRKLDDSEFRNAFSRTFIRVREYDSRYDSRRSYSRSRSRSRSRSPSYSRSLSGSPRSIYCTVQKAGRHIFHCLDLDQDLFPLVVIQFLQKGLYLDPIRDQNPPRLLSHDHTSSERGTAAAEAEARRVLVPLKHNQTVNFDRSSGYNLLELCLSADLQENPIRDQNPRRLLSHDHTSSERGTAAAEAEARRVLIPLKHNQTVNFDRSSGYNLLELCLSADLQESRNLTVLA
ncbi:hypothetical protein M5K25_002237 [Dendrobium thyrsiflorum]|uniref:RRM domain-containing protein n=1 Tax=Dendrobium thyrsiflorum TaxID=117978 RepID=A0ABD0VSF7_DENTH